MAYNLYGYRQDQGVNAIRGRDPTPPASTGPTTAVVNPDTSVSQTAAANPFLSTYDQFGLWGAPTTTSLGFNPAAPGIPVTAPAPVNPAVPAAAAGTAEANQAAIQGELEAAAQAYRNLPATASVAERAAAMENYQNLLQAKSATGAPRSVDIALGNEIVNPLIDPRVAHYRTFLDRSGRDPNMIGPATIDRLTGKMEVPFIAEEERAQRLQNEANFRYGEAKRDEQWARKHEPKLVAEAQQRVAEARQGLGSYDEGFRRNLAQAKMIEEARRAREIEEWRRRQGAPI